jgi:serine/threonine protein kinase
MPDDNPAPDGRYEMLSKIGQGRRASVYKAFDHELQKYVAIKVFRLPAGRAVYFRKKFEEEARAQSHLSHPNLVAVLNWGDFSGSPCLVTEFAPGGPLDCQLGRPMPWYQAAGLLAPVARALDFAHQNKILHRNVKPSNILLRGDQPLLTDFSITSLAAAGYDEAVPGSGGAGTPEYMAPEQWQGGQPAPSIDIFALGVVLFEMVTGRKPFEGSTIEDLRGKIITDPHPRPRGLIPTLPESVEQVIDSALAKDPAERCPSMDAFARSLDRLAAQEQAARALIDMRTELEKIPASQPVKTRPVQSARGSWWTRLTNRS